MRDDIVAVDTPTLFQHGVHLPTLTLFLDGDVDTAMASKTARALHVLDLAEGNITIMLNTTGGERSAGFAIYDLIRACKSPTRIVGYGDIASMGVVIMQAAKVRELLPTTRLLVHPGYGATAYDMDENVKRGAAECIRGRDLIYKIIGDKMGLSRDDMYRRFTWDTFLSAREGVRLNLADKVVQRA